MKIVTKAGLLLGTAVVGSVLGIGITSIAFAGNPGTPAPEPVQAAEAPVTLPVEKPVYDVNQAGQSFGSLVGVAEQDDWPDLIDTIGDDGKTQGFVLKSDFIGPQPQTPEEAVRIQNEVNSKPRTIPLYAKDGVTVIGTFTIQGVAEPLSTD